MTDKLTRYKELVEWSITLICNSSPDKSVNAEEWKQVTDKYIAEANEIIREK